MDDDSTRTFTITTVTPDEARKVAEGIAAAEFPGEEVSIDVLHSTPAAGDDSRRETYTWAHEVAITRVGR